MNPSYFKIINRFWDEAPDLNGYKTDHSALFFAILDSINRNGWRDTEIEYDRIINKVRLGKKNYLEGRKWLHENKFIVFRPGKGDYAKAKFGLGIAVLPKTASDTANESGAVPDSTAGDTAGDTASDTSTGTASDTHLIGEPLTSNLLLLTNQQQPALPADAVVEKKENDSVEAKKKEGSGPTPNPLPTEQEVREKLAESEAHWKYAKEQMKLVERHEQYLDLIESFILQQQMKAENGSPVFPELHKVRHHFMNWLGKQDIVNYQKNGNSNTSDPNHLSRHRGAKGTLRPTAIGQPDYRGEGSHCDVEL